jgi:hypothetical protein
LVLGDEFFCNGGAWWCIHQEDGSIFRIDIELDDSIEFANTSVAHFTSVLLATVNWSSKCKRTQRNWRQEVDQLADEVGFIDKRAMKSPRHFWYRLLEYFRDEGPPPTSFEKGSRTEGERTQKAGPW